jgi:hypothetical protein
MYFALVSTLLCCLGYVLAQIVPQLQMAEQKPVELPASEPKKIVIIGMAYCILAMDRC